MKIWYMTEDDNVNSSYTDFTQLQNNKPVRKRTVRKAESSYTDFTSAGSFNKGSSYTDFTSAGSFNEGSSYIDFTQQGSSKPAGRRNVRKPARSYSAVSNKKRHSVRKAVLCVFGAAALVLTSVAGTWFYMSANDNNGGLESEAVDIEEFLSNLPVNAGLNTEEKDTSSPRRKKVSYEKSVTKSEGSYSESGSAYKAAKKLMSSLERDSDVDTAWEIFNWVHSNISYQPITSSQSFEEAALRGFTRKSGDCFVYYACAKMLLDCAGIPNMMVERYPVITNGHYWNLVQLNGEWYHCDATVFIDHPDMYFMCTDEEIADEHHSFDSDLYPERASGYAQGWGPVFGQPGPAYEIDYDDYSDYDEYYEEDYSDYEEDYSDYYLEDWD